MDTLVKNEKVIANYIKNQLEEDFTKDRITLKELQTRLRVKEISKAKQTATQRWLFVIVMRWLPLITLRRVSMS